ncbi:MAG: diaminopimelate decarboxylase [Lachnospiraceae bacterium]|nr:diaminopimelate decarboxylase [Lachnospiraceae bacterium]
MRSFIERIDYFKGNDPEELAKKFGTPLYVYNEDIIRDRMTKVANVITKYPYRANYSCKTNTNLSVLKIAIETGLNADAMSEGEMRMLLKAGFTPDRIFYVCNNVSADEMKFAIDNGITVSLDSLDQLKLFGSINRGGSCSVRINPGVGAGHHEKVVTAGKKTKFGISEEDIDSIFKIAAEYDLKITGINQHVGSQFLDPAPFLAAVDNLLRIAMRFKDLEFIDFGGGYGIPYHKLDDEKEFDMDQFSREFTAKLDRFVAEYGSAPLFKSEPGRFCVAEGGVILGRVYSIKENSGIKYVGTDVGMNVLVRPSMYDSWHDIEIIRNGSVVGREDGLMEKVTVCGNICESGDVLCKDRELPVVKDDDLICVLDAGAYGYSMCSSYNTRLRPAEVLITSDGTAKLIRRRETFDDMFALYDFT